MRDARLRLTTAGGVALTRPLHRAGPGGLEASPTPNSAHEGGTINSLSLNLELKIQPEEGEFRINKLGEQQHSHFQFINYFLSEVVEFYF